MPEILFFPYFGPSRRADCRVIEINLDFGSDDSSTFSPDVPDVMQTLIDAGVLSGDEQFPEKPLPEEKTARYSALLAQASLLLQRKGGHRVDYFSVFPDPDRNKYIALVEHEDSKVGMAAVKLACRLLSGNMESPAKPFQSFAAFARDRALPVDTQAIINSARRRGIPVFQAEREPLADHMDTSLNIRKNSSLILGHGAACRLLDGTFCLDMAGEYLKAMRRNPDQRKDLMRQMGLPVVKAAGRQGVGVRRYCLLIIDQKVTTIELLTDGNMRVIDDVHVSFIAMCRAIREKLGLSPIVVSLEATDISQAQTEANGVIVDFDLTPDLGHLLGSCEGTRPLLDEAADDLIDWLFPDPAAARVPIIAITGTNGKTTTTRMVSHILQKCGHKPGFVCTDGIYLNTRQVSGTDAGAFIGHARVLSSKLIDAAVLESHHQGIAVRGFAFESCDVGVCLNVTEEHLRKGEIETSEQMAVIKRALVERASKAAVLFADDANCVAMLDFIRADIVCLVSLKSDIRELRKLARHKDDSFCVLEAIEDKEWIVLYDAQQRMPVMPVLDAPATFEGTARFNVSNLMHAVASSYFTGIDIKAIAAAMRSFVMGFDTTPGRLNVFDELPFRVIMDYAHNADGFRKILEFLDSQVVTGRKILMLSYPGNRQDDDIRTAVTELAGHFDHYVCRSYFRLRGRQAHEIPAILNSALMAAGISESDISVVPEADKAVQHTLGLAAPGDLVFLQVGDGDFQYVWSSLQSMAAR